jgi:PAS domain S-box-containing protein
MNDNELKFRGEFINSPLKGEAQKSIPKAGISPNNLDFLSRVFDRIDALVLVLNRDGRVVRFNRACERLFGYSTEEIRQKITTGALPLTEEIGEIKNLIKNIRAGSSENRFENQWITNDGQVCTIMWSITTLLDNKNKVEYILATGIDITRRKLAESLLVLEKNLLRSLINSIPDLIFYKDLNGIYLGCNTKFEAIRSLTEKEIIGKKDKDLYTEELVERLSEIDDLVVRKGVSLTYEDWMQDSTGNPILIETRKTPYYGVDRQILGVIGIGHDITKHRLIENELRKAKAEIENLISSLSSVLIVLTPDGCIAKWNPMAHKLFNIPSTQAERKPLKEVAIEWDWEPISRGIERCREEVRPIYLDPVRFKRTDGVEGYLGVSISPIREDEDGLSGFILLCGDITERKILENRLAQVNKLESIGGLAAGIAHEINTPIQYVGDNTNFLNNNFSELIALLQQYRLFLEQARSGEITAEQIAMVDSVVSNTDLDFLIQEIPLAIQQSLEGIRRVSEIVQTLKEFSHPGIKEKTASDINKAIMDTLTVSRHEWKYVAEIETNLDPNLPKVPCHPAEISQVFLNIIVNAAQAIDSVVAGGMNGKGVITISTQSDQEWVEIRIKDTGPGIPEEIRSRVYEPFFTTKEVGKGSGQGLAIAYDVVERKHAGFLTFETNKGAGTTFIIRLPIDAL